MEEEILKVFYEMFKIYIRPNRNKQKFNLNYSNIKLAFESLIFHVINPCPVEFLISLQCTLPVANSTMKQGYIESELHISVQWLEYLTKPRSL